MKTSVSILVGAVCLSWSLSTHAQSAEPAIQDAILILDASGSMWGQIDGINKIVIAKDTVETLVRSLPAHQRLGLVAYGHRKEGDCNDIQTIADVGANRDNVIKAIRALSPKGKTPLSKSVEHAATALNYTKNAATVILVSDGLENCEADPCALAKTLEENGLDFTVHVIGFDVTEQERNGLRCIAAETGGRFLAASNADELTEALVQVAVQGSPQPDPGASEAQPQSVALKATLLKGGPDIQSRVNWKVTNTQTDAVVFTKDNTGYADFKVVPGDYVAEAVWTGWPHKGERVAGNKTGSKAFTIFPARPAVVTVPIDLGIPVTLETDTQISEGEPVNIAWSGPDDLGATISTNRLDDGPRVAIYFAPAQRARDAYQKAAEKDAVEIDSNGDGSFDQDDIARTQIGGPSVEGNYEVRYVLDKPRVILARKMLNVTDGNYAVRAPKEVPPAEKFTIEWEGTLTSGDFVTMEKVGTRSAYTPGRHAVLKAGQPAELTAYAEPGDYEVRYVLANGYTTYAGMNHAVQAVAPVTIAEVSAGTVSPDTAVGGSTLSFTIRPHAGTWEDDWISIIKPGTDKTNSDARYEISRLKNTDGTYSMRVPAVAGEYEIAYFLQPGSRVIGREPLVITQAKASVDAPASVKAGTDFEVRYSGDAFRGDRVVVVPADKPDTAMWGATLAYGFAAVKGESTGRVRGSKAVPKPGEYEARYVTGLQHVVLARDKITVTE